MYSDLELVSPLKMLDLISHFVAANCMADLMFGRRNLPADSEGANLAVISSQISRTGQLKTLFHRSSLTEVTD